MFQLLLVLFLSFFSHSAASTCQGSPLVVNVVNNEKDLCTSSFLPFNLNTYLPAPNSFLVWQRRRPLQWHDFKGKPEATDKIHGAVTYAGLDVEVEDNSPIRFSVVAIFDQQRSWVHPEKKDAQLLAHEQLHFDIAAVYAYKLEQKLNSLRNKWNRETVKDLIALYRQAQLEAQTRYDEDSLHGIRREQQKAWRSLINQELRAASSRLHLEI